MGVLCVGLLLWGIASLSSAQDTVRIASEGDDRAEIRLSGRVVDYTGRQLLLALPNGQQRNIPAVQVIGVETPTTRDHVLADQLFSQGDHQQALPHYLRARDEDQRPWVRRQITARMVWCYQSLGQTAVAGEEFLLLIRSDPDTLYFACIPLAWLPSQPSPELEQAARRWVERQDMPAAVLLGASHLMSTARPSALDQLRRLAASTDRRIAQLAIAQIWRAATADDAETAGWQRAIDEMPEDLRGGPYVVLGTTLLGQQRWEQAALALLRVPILYPEHRQLATRSLLDAAGALERLQRPRQAARLYRELIALGGTSRDAAEARGRLETLGAAPGKP